MCVRPRAKRSSSRVSHCNGPQIAGAAVHGTRLNTSSSHPGVTVGRGVVWPRVLAEGMCVAVTSFPFVHLWPTRVVRNENTAWLLSLSQL